MLGDVVVERMPGIFCSDCIAVFRGDCSVVILDNFSESQKKNGKKGIGGRYVARQSLFELLAMITRTINEFISVWMRG